VIQTKVVRTSDYESFFDPKTIDVKTSVTPGCPRPRQYLATTPLAPQSAGTAAAAVTKFFYTLFFAKCRNRERVIRGG